MLNRLRNHQRTKFKCINFNWVFQAPVLKSVLCGWGIVLLGLLERAGLPVCLSVRLHVARVCALGRWALGCTGLPVGLSVCVPTPGPGLCPGGRWVLGCVCARVGRLCGEKERRRLGCVCGRQGVDRGLCGEQLNGASWLCLRSRFCFCSITSPWPTSQDKFFSTTFYLEEPFCIFIKIFQGLISECPDVAVSC